MLFLLTSQRSEHLQIILENLLVPVSGILVAQILVDARWQNGVSSVGVDSVVVEGTTVAGRALEPSFLRAESELVLRAGVAKLAVEPIAHGQVRDVRGKFRQLFAAARRIRVVDRSRRPTKIRRVDRWPIGRPGRATGLRFLGLEVQGQVLHVDRPQLAALPRILMTELAALRLRLLDGGRFHARKGRVVSERASRYLVSPLRERGGVVNREGGLVDRRCSRESAGREGGPRVVVESGVGRVLGRPLGATTGFVIGRPNERVLDTWRDHRARSFGPATGFGNAMPDRSRRSFSRFFYAAQRNAGAAPPAPPPPLPVTRSQRDDEIKLWPDFTPPSSPRAPSFPFFRPLSLRPRVLFLS